MAIQVRFREQATASSETNVHKNNNKGKRSCHASPLNELVRLDLQQFRRIPFSLPIVRSRIENLLEAKEIWEETKLANAPKLTGVAPPSQRVRRAPDCCPAPTYGAEQQAAERRRRCTEADED